MTALDKAEAKATEMNKLKEEFNSQFALYMTNGSGLSRLYRLQQRLQAAERSSD